MNPRWRRFLLLLTIIGCALLHAPRLNQMQAKSVPQPAPSPKRVKSPATVQPLTSKWTLAPWKFDASPLPPLDDQPLAFVLLKEPVKEPTSAQVDAIAQDLAFFVDTEFALEPTEPRPFPRTIGRLPARPAAITFVFQPRRVRNGRGINYVKPALWTPDPLAFASRSPDLPLRVSNRTIARRPQTTETDEETTVGETPDPSPVAGEPTPTPTPGPVDTGNEGGAIDPPDTGGLGGIGGLPPPGGVIPEPALLAPLLGIAMLLHRRPR
jgi:hypothetical protein